MELDELDQDETGSSDTDREGRDKGWTATTLGGVSLVQVTEAIWEASEARHDIRLGRIIPMT